MYVEGNYTHYLSSTLDVAAASGNLVKIDVDGFTYEYGDDNDNIDAP